MPFYVVGKEISLEDVRLTLEKIPDRLYEHPSTVVVLTNLYYSESAVAEAESRQGRAGSDLERSRAHRNSPMSLKIS
jgi:hypothetical protein